jgi:hypothetical protein
MSEQQPSQGQPQDPPAVEPQPKQDSPAERRINQLYGQAQEAQKQAAQFEAANTELRTQLAALQEKMTLIESRSPVAPVDPFSPQPASQNASGLDTKKLINEAVQQAVGPFIAQQQQQHELAQLQTAQNQSLAQAALEFPELNDRQSALHQNALSILKNDEHLRLHPNGPYLAAMAARGAMVPGVPADPQQKLAAAQPAAGGVPVPGDGGRTFATVEAEYDAVQQKARQTVSQAELRQLYIQADQLKKEMAQLK